MKRGGEACAGIHLRLPLEERVPKWLWCAWDRGSWGWERTARDSAAVIDSTSRSIFCHKKNNNTQHVTTAHTCPLLTTTTQHSVSGTHSVRAPVSQKGSHVGHAEVGIVSLRGLLLLCRPLVLLLGKWQDDAFGCCLWLSGCRCGC